MEDGVPFCPHCNAPQIRVAGASAEAAAELNPISIPQLPGAGIHWPQALPAASLAGLIAALAMFISAGAFLLGMAAAGVLSVVFYRRRQPGSYLTSGMGARLGALAGVLGFAVFGIFSGIGTLVFHSGGELRSALLDAIQQAAARANDPPTQQAIEYLKSPPGMALMVGMSMAFVLLAFVALSTLGGIVAAAMMQRRGRL